MFLLLVGFYKVTSAVYAIAEAMVEKDIASRPDMTDEEMFRRLKENHERRRREREEIE